MRLGKRRDEQDADAPADVSGEAGEAPSPQPEHEEPRHRDPGPSDLSKRDYFAAARRAVKEAGDDQITDAAAALAYYAFLAIPATLLVAVGLFSLFAGPEAVETVLEKVGTVAPAETVTLLDESLTRITENESSGLVMTILGLVLALWTATGAMNALMRALNRAYDREETRGFIRQRATALAMIAFAFLAFALAFGLLVLGPHLSDWLGSLLGLETIFGWIWWIGQWPILIGGLLLAFAAILYLGPNVDHPRWSYLTLGSAVAVVLWLLASGAFAVYVALFASYNKTWGSLAAVIIMLTWLWLSGLALLFGAEVNAEVERSRELRRGEPAERDIQAPPKA